MAFRISALVVLLLCANWATADYLLVKLKLDHMSFGQLKVKEAGKGPVTGGVGKDPIKMEDPEEGDTPGQWIHAVVEHDADKLFLFPPPEPPGIVTPPQKLGQPPKGGIGAGTGAMTYIYLNLPSGNLPSGKKIFIPLRFSSAEDAITNTRELRTVQSLEFFGTRLAVQDLGLRPPAEIFAAKKKVVDYDFATKKKDGYPEALRRLAEGALKHGLYGDFHKTMAKLIEEKPDHKSAVAYLKVKKDMENPVQPAQLAKAVEDELKGYKAIFLSKSRLSPQGHYEIYFKDGTDILSNVERRLERMEEAYCNFFYYLALQDNVPQAEIKLPPLPRQRLVVVLETTKDFAQKKERLGNSQEPSAGFTWRSENVVVLSSRPTSLPYQNLERGLQRVIGDMGLTTNDLVNGTIWERGKDGKEPRGVDVITEANKGNPNPMNPMGKGGAVQPPVGTGVKEVKRVIKVNYAALQTLAMMQRAMERDSEVSCISRECTRQLLRGTGMLAANVASPEWFEDGVAGFFENPPDQLYAGFGLPRGEYVRVFKNLRENKAVHSADLLTKLAGDDYFRVGPSKMKNKDRQLTRGHAIAWSLVYYLAGERKLHGLLTNYAEQLNVLPRHMPLHPRTLQACFANTFSSGDNRLDAQKWFDELSLTTRPENPAEVEAFYGVEK